ncbi:MAG: flippase-like domain-containing protein, partial [Acidobacteriota bacterium]|nr:flippase-like domain-containing protein [Acidobacteriota bacterium]
MKTFERVSLALGLLLFGWLLHRVGLSEVWLAVRGTGWGFLAILGLFGINETVTALGWRAVLPDGQRVPLSVLFGIQAAGNAINTVSPGVVGGELLRVSLLRRHVPTVSAASSVALAAGCQFAAQVLFVVAGVPWVIGRLVGSPFRIRLLLLAAVAAGIFLVAAWLARRSDLFERLHSFLGRLLPKTFAPGTAASWRDLDTSIFGALHHRRGRLALSIAMYFTGWSLGVVETFLILRLLGSPADWRTCTSIEILAVILDALFFFVPGHLGTEEGGRYAIFKLLGLAPSLGFSVAIVKRLRELAWTAAGFAILALSQTREPLAAVGGTTPPA